MIKLVVAEYTQAKVNDMLAKQEEEFNVRIVAINEAHAEEITEINEAHAEEITELNATIDGLEAEIVGLEAELENAKPLPEEAFNITGDCNRRFANGSWDWFIENYGNQVTTKDIAAADDMFSQSNVTEIPFVLNVNKVYRLNNLFNLCKELTEIPAIRGNLSFNTSLDMSSMFNGCLNVRNLENAFTPEMLEDLSAIKVTSTYSTPNYSNLLASCYSLRQVPTWFYKLRFSEESTAYPAYGDYLYSYALQDDYTLDEVINFPVLRCNANSTSNMFPNTFSNNHRLKNMTFETNNGTPYVVKWKAQTIDLSDKVGYSNRTNKITNYNSGITADKEVRDDATYQALKNNPDWFTTKIEYSRYNHDSAVATINSLPDTSAYLATAGGTNTIKFKGASGSKTDGGAINTLTAEEIAVAAAKGWTISFA